MEKPRKNLRANRTRKADSNSRADERRRSRPQAARLVDSPGVRAVIRRARKPYAKNPLSEDEALNLICDARKDEPTIPLSRLLKKYKDELGD